MKYHAKWCGVISTLQFHLSHHSMWYARFIFTKGWCHYVNILVYCMLAVSFVQMYLTCCGSYTDRDISITFKHH